MANPSGYEKRDVHISKLLLAIFLTAGFVFLSPFALYQVFIRTHENLHFERVLLPVAPDFLEHQATERERANSYARLSQDPEVYRIPIERALQLVLSEAGDSSQVR